MTALEFKAQEYQADGSFRDVSYRYEGEEQSGWRILREGSVCLELPQGYRLLRSIRCGICATDLVRNHLPFPLPQIIGHEVVAQDESGRIVAAEINASHLSTRSPLALCCPLCQAGLPTHCPDRLVLGIDRLPGGFSPWILVPVGNIVEIPITMRHDISVLIEPFAAALHATQRIDLTGATRVAVLGAGRLGLLLVAALKDTREAVGGSFTIEAIDRYAGRLAIAKLLGADTTWQDAMDLVGGSGSSPPFDIVIEATGSPHGLQTALTLASREVHVKTTSGLETLGLKKLTELVVDEVSLGRFDPEMIGTAPSRRDTPASALVLGTSISTKIDSVFEKAGYRVVRAATVDELTCHSHCGGLPGGIQADFVVVDSIEGVDRVIRPRPDIEQGLVMPRGAILLADVGQARTGMLGHILDSRKRLTTSRCGDFHKALPSMERLVNAGVDLGCVITDRLGISDLPLAFERARSPESLKVVVVHKVEGN